MKKTKGQVTMFIIIGILLLLGVMSIVYIANRTRISQTDVEASTGNLPPFAQPVNQFVEDCIQKVSINAFEKIGEHGGYIDFDDYDIVQDTFNINTQEPTESDAVSLSPGTNSPIAYWWYMSTPNNCNDCLVDSLVPELDYIEHQINRYVNRELLVCLTNFSSFKAQNLEFATGKVNTTTTINSNDVDISINYPISITLSESRVNVNNFKVTLDLDFYHNFMLAYLIANHEVDKRFIEDTLTHLIGIYSSTPDSAKIPPISWVDSRSAVSWNKNEVKERISKELLASNIPLLQVNNTKNAAHIKANDPIQQGVYDVMFLNFLENNFPNLQVDFFYNPNWPFYFNVRCSECRGNDLNPITVKTKDSIGFFPVIKTNYYEFFYDVSFPIVVIVRDTKSLKKYGKKGYSFMFALEGNIRDNKDLYLWNQGNGTIGPMDYSGVSMSIRTTNSSPVICNQTNSSDPNSKWICPLNNQEYDDMMACGSNCITETHSTISPSITQSLFCNYEQRISKNITIDVINSATDSPIPSASIDYSCGNYRICPMGETSENGIYSSKFPLCIGDGYLTVEKEGYVTKIEPHVSINLDDEKQFTIKMDQISQIEPEIVFINITNLFRIRNMIYNDYESISSLMDQISNPLNNIIWTNSHSAAPSDRLTVQEANIVLNQLNIAKNRLTNAKDSIKDIEHYYQISRNNIVSSTRSTKTAVDSAYSFAYKLNTDPNWIGSAIGRQFTGNIQISSNVLSSLNAYSNKISKELENIQFIESSQLSDSSKLSEHRNKANSLNPAEEIIISLEKIKEDQYEQNLPVLSSMITAHETLNLSLVPGTYKVTLTSQYSEGYNISPSTLISSLPSSILSSIISSIPQQDIEYTYAGGSSLDNSSGYWIINENQIKTAKKVRFYVFRLDKAENLEDIGELGKIEEYSKRYRAYIEPEFLP
ncbi:MAG: hypothetical protein KKC54_07845 [Nanoarchaeota archaeon]|nr:hypothetical protein [Nanoarchaeota archaeon]